ncbi:MAG: Rha family transcriptional regulator [Methylococcaceae bacterium]
MSAIISIIERKETPRIDSRLIAESLGLQHKNILSLVDQYKSDFEQLGPLPFETRKGKALDQGGYAKSTRFALLNEDQSYLFLTYSRNTKRTRSLKIELVKAFARFRSGKQVEADYLPFYHEYHDKVKTLASIQNQAGHTVKEDLLHINFNKLVKRAFGITDFKRSTLDPTQRVKVTHAIMTGCQILDGCIHTKLDHKESYQRVKIAVYALAGTDNRLEA